MMKSRLLNLFRKTATSVLTGLFFANTTAAYAQSNCNVDAMLVFDGSGSMAEMGFNGLDNPRIVDARSAIRKSMPQITPHRNVGLITYGPGKNDACENINLRFTPQPDAAQRLIGEINLLRPNGNTPLTQSVRLAAEALDYINMPGIVVLVTDGKETCGGAPCQLAPRLSERGIDLIVHVIGFQVRSDYFAWNSQRQEEFQNGTTVARCLADITGGLYVSTETTDELTNALRKTLGCAVVG